MSSEPLFVNVLPDFDHLGSVMPSKLVRRTGLPVMGSTRAEIRKRLGQSVRMQQGSVLRYVRTHIQLQNTKGCKHGCSQVTVCECVHRQACIHTYIHTYIHTDRHTCMHTHIYIYIYIYICVCVCVCACTCICIYTHT